MYTRAPKQNKKEHPFLLVVLKKSPRRAFQGWRSDLANFVSTVPHGIVRERSTSHGYMLHVADIQLICIV
jgi:hypothetical protein